MNTVGNLGGFTANILTGYILKYYTMDINKDLAPAAYKEAMDFAWVINFLVFSGVYVAAVFLWLGFDATKPVAPQEVEPH